MVAKLANWSGFEKLQQGLNRGLRLLRKGPATSEATPIEMSIPPVRRMGLTFEGMPRFWFLGNARTTAVLNALSLLFPAGERFFIRSVRHYESQIQDETLKRAMKGFYGQESHHQKEHLVANQALEAQGYEIASYLKWWEIMAFEKVEPRFPPHIRLAATAAAEHFTSTLADIALRERMLGHAHPTMQDLLFWHAAEEIEHKSVTYDVLQVVDPRYSTRVAGFVVVSAVLLYGWVVGMRHLMKQDKGLESTPLPPEIRHRLRKTWLKTLLTLGDYFRPGFHPEQHNNRHLAQEYLKSIGRADG